MNHFTVSLMLLVTQTLPKSCGSYMLLPIALTSRLQPAVNVRC
jgi:hypothetical protein